MFFTKNHVFRDFWEPLFCLLMQFRLGSKIELVIFWKIKLCLSRVTLNCIFHEKKARKTPNETDLVQNLATIFSGHFRVGLLRLYHITRVADFSEIPSTNLQKPFKTSENHKICQHWKAGILRNRSLFGLSCVPVIQSLQESVLSDCENIPSSFFQ